jgi:hypothetical protein
MIGEMIVWGFFSAMGWMLANWTVDQVMPTKPPAIECKKEEEKKNGTSCS